jgi:hypothetical protein
LGGGLVVSVTPLVNRSTLLTTELAAFSTPVTTVLAKSAPGRVGRVTGVPPVDGLGIAGRAGPALAAQGR